MATDNFVWTHYSDWLNFTVHSALISIDEWWNHDIIIQESMKFKIWNFSLKLSTDNNRRVRIGYCHLFDDSTI